MPYNCTSLGMFLIVYHAAPRKWNEVVSIFCFMMTHTPFLPAIVFFFPLQAVVVASVVAHLDASRTPTVMEDLELSSRRWCIVTPCLGERFGMDAMAALVRDENN